jgi:hypothetical protein
MPRDARLERLDTVMIEESSRRERIATACLAAIIAKLPLYSHGARSAKTTGADERSTEDRNDIMTDAVVGALMYADALIACLNEENRQRDCSTQNGDGKLMPIPIGLDNRCQCTCGTTCPIGKTGASVRCTADELINARVAILRLSPNDNYYGGNGLTPAEQPSEKLERH